MQKQKTILTARKYLRPDKMNIVLVGDKALIMPGLRRLGYEMVEVDADAKPLQKKAF